MQKLILYIQPQLTTTTTIQDFVRVDLMEEDLIELTQVIQDVSDIEKIFTDYSRTFNLPASKTNNKIFKHWYNPEIDGFDNQIFCNARIELNHLHFKFGKIKLEEAVLKNGQPSMYKVTFFGNTVSFKNAINKEQLSDLVWLNEFNHNATATNVQNGLENGLNFTVDSVAYNDAIIYPLITHSQSYIFDTSSDVKLSGTVTSSASNKLVDTSENFTNVVIVGDVVKNTTTTSIAAVTAIDSNTSLTLSSDIMSNGENYEIYDTTGLNICSTGFKLDQRGVVPEDLKPAILIKHIIKSIEQKYNITFKTGEFLDSTAINNLYMWLHREKGKMATAGTWVGNNDIYTCSGSNCTELTDTTSTLGYFRTGSGILNWHKQRVDDGFTVLTDETILTLQITPASGYTSVVYDMEIVRANNWESFVVTKNNSGTSTITLNIGGTNGFDVDTVYNANPFPSTLEGALAGSNFTEFVGRINAQTSIQFQATFNLTRTVHVIRDSNNSDFRNFTYSATFTSNSSNITPQESLVIITDQVPKLKVKDFLNGLFRQFNLTAYVDFNDEIVVKTLDNYYAGGDTHDITQYVKTEQHTVCDVIPFSEVDFEYAEPKSILAETFFNANNKKYGELNYVTDSSQKNLYQIKLPFEHMLFERLQDKTSNAFTAVQVGSFIDSNLEPSIGQPLLFYGIYQENVSADSFINFLDSTRPETYGALCPAGTNSSLNDYWIPSACNELGTSSTAPTYNLNFGSEINTYTLTDYGGNTNSLFQTYYTNYITRVFNKKTRIFKFSAILPLKVLLNLTLDDLIVVGTRAYTINKMSTKLQSGETNFELLNEPT